MTTPTVTKLVTYAEGLGEQRADITKLVVYYEGAEPGNDAFVSKMLTYFEGVREWTGRWKPDKPGGGANGGHGGANKPPSDTPKPKGRTRHIGQSVVHGSGTWRRG